jgi:hydrogenase maturation protease
LNNKIKKLATSNFGSILVIGYGNSLRSDDGAGCRVSDIVASWDLPYVRSLTVHQLTPELAEPIAQSELAIFIDAWVGGNGSAIKRKKSSPVLQVQKIDVSKQLNAAPINELGHLSDPRSLLLLAKQVYGEVPVAYSLLLPAVNWEFGEQVSAVTRKSIEQAADFLQKLCTKLVSSNQC